MNRAAYILSAILALALAADASAVLPHPFHLSLAEVDCNRVTGELEVALAVLAIDFEETLSRRAGKRVNLDRTRGITTIIEDYLAERLRKNYRQHTDPATAG